LRFMQICWIGGITLYHDTVPMSSIASVNQPVNLVLLTDNVLQDLIRIPEVLERILGLMSIQEKSHVIVDTSSLAEFPGYDVFRIIPGVLLLRDKTSIKGRYSILFHALGKVDVKSHQERFAVSLHVPVHKSVAGCQYVVVHWYVECCE